MTISSDELACKPHHLYFVMVTTLMFMMVMMVMIMMTLSSRVMAANLTVSTIHRGPAAAQGGPVTPAQPLWPEQLLNQNSADNDCHQVHKYLHGSKLENLQHSKFTNFSKFILYFYQFLIRR